MSQLNFNEWFSTTRMNMDKVIYNSGVVYGNIEGIGIRNLNFPPTPKIKFTYLEENETFEQLVNFYHDFRRSLSKSEESEYYDIETFYAFNHTLLVGRVYKTELQLIVNKVSKEIENLVEVELNLFKDNFRQKFSSIQQTNVSFDELKESVLVTWNKYLNFELVYYSPKELEDNQKRFGGIPLSNPYKHGPKYWIDEIDQSFRNGTSIVDAYCSFKKEKVVSTIAIRNAIDWLEKLKESEVEEKTDFFTRLQNRKEEGKLISFENGLKVIEYNFEDWFTHGVGVNYILFGESSFKNEEQKYFYNTLYNDEYRIGYDLQHRISFSEALKINAKRTELFDEAVSEIFDYFKKDFEERKTKDDLKSFVQAEIKYWKRVISTDDEQSIKISPNQSLKRSKLNSQHFEFIERNLYSTRYNYVDRQWKYRGNENQNLRKKYVLVSAIHIHLMHLNKYVETTSFIDLSIFLEENHFLAQKESNAITLQKFQLNNIETIQRDEKLNWSKTWKDLYSFCHYWDYNRFANRKNDQSYGKIISRFFTLQGKEITSTNAGKKLSELVIPQDLNNFFSQIKK